MSTLEVTLGANIAAWSGIAGAAIAVAALLTAIAAGSSMRHWRTRCAALESNIAALRRGVDPGKLIQQFGLSRSEAELVARLHGRKKRA